MSEMHIWPGWQNVRLLGKGSYGKVYEICREDFGKSYKAALKVISIPRSEEELEDAYNEGMSEEEVKTYFYNIVEKIAREFAIMSDLKGQTNIVSYDDHKVIDHKDGFGWDILVKMELLHPLLKWNQEHPLTEEDVMNLGCDICKALEICHENNILHRDIKPDNIFINDHNDYKLGDFGVSRIVEQTTSTLTSTGTRPYMAPEVYLGKEYGKQADIYSLGTVLYRFLNHNRTPFLPTDTPIHPEDRMNAIERRVIQGENIPEPLDGSDELKKVVLKALEFEPENRYQSAADFRKALEECKKKYERADIPTGDSASSNNEEVDPTEKADSVEDEDDFYESTGSIFGVGKSGKSTAERKEIKSEEQKEPKKKEASNEPEENNGAYKNSNFSWSTQTSLSESKIQKKSNPIPLIVGGIAAVCLIGGGAFFMSRKTPPTPASTVSDTKVPETQSGTGTEDSNKEDSASAEAEKRSVFYEAEGEYSVATYDEIGRTEERAWYSEVGEYLRKYIYTYNDENYTGVGIRYDEDGSENGRIEYTYDENWRKQTATRYNKKEEKKYVREYSYDSEGQLAESARFSADGELEEKITYGAFGNELKRMSFDSDGNVKSEEEGEFDENGNQTKWTRRNGDGATEYGYTSTYDKENNRTEITWFVGENTLLYTVTYSPNLQNCSEAVLTIYDSDGAEVSSKTVDNPASLELPEKTLETTGGNSSSDSDTGHSSQSSGSSSRTYDDEEDDDDDEDIVIIGDDDDEDGEDEEGDDEDGDDEEWDENDGDEGDVEGDNDAGEDEGDNDEDVDTNGNSGNNDNSGDNGNDSYEDDGDAAENDWEEDEE